MIEMVLDMIDQLPLIIMISAMALIIAILLIIIFVLWKRMKKDRVCDDPFVIMGEIYSEDKDGNGIPDHIDAMIKRMKGDGRSHPGEVLSHSSSYTVKQTRNGRTWGMSERNENGKITQRKWGDPPDQGDELFSRLYDEYVNGKISAEDFRKEMETLKVT